MGVELACGGGSSEVCRPSLGQIDVLGVCGILWYLVAMADGRGGDAVGGGRGGGAAGAGRGGGAAVGCRARGVSRSEPWCYLWRLARVVFITESGTS